MAAGSVIFVEALGGNTLHTILMQHALYVVAAASATSAPDTEVTTRYNTDNIGLHEPLLMIADESWAGVFLFTLDETNLSEP